MEITALRAVMLLKNVEAQRQHLPKSAKCFSCLRRGHIVAKCRSNLKCTNCGRRHYVSICEENKTRGKVKTEDNTKDSASSDGKFNKQEPQDSIQALCSSGTSILMKTFVLSSMMEVIELFFFITKHEDKAPL